MEMLERLPAKSVGRCRCVSRLWCSSLTDPGFIHKHAMKASENPNINEKLFCLDRYNNLLIKVTPEIYSDDQHSTIDNILEAAEKLVLPKKVPLRPEYGIYVDTCSIVGSCHIALYIVVMLFSPLIWQKKSVGRSFLRAKRIIITWLD
ncbi:hypothetical protein COLO4_10033 [Corchorus olitorius]|uniref:F-box domain-containing protein n=1 Tax=Corchorus olitorius TaxID=93759 RepID=A0A1R3KAB5_9ROSI|nr:hypothetical protein COLO4_10033 [Corchorus olitorius]